MELALIIEKKSERVLFAEAGKDFVELISSKLSGNSTKAYSCTDHQYATVVPNMRCPTCRLPMKCEMYVADKAEFKSSLAPPPSAANRDTHTEPKIYVCPYLHMGHRYFSDVIYLLCPICLISMRQEMKLVSPAVQAVAKMETTRYQGERYAVMDNLNVKPLPITTMSSPADIVQNDREEKFMPINYFQTLLKELNFGGVVADDFELRVVNFGIDNVCICSGAAEGSSRRSGDGSNKCLPEEELMLIYDAWHRNQRQP